MILRDLYIFDRDSFFFLADNWEEILGNVSNGASNRILVRSCFFTAAKSYMRKDNLRP